MNDIAKLVKSREIRGITDYFSLSRQLDEALKNDTSCLRVALLTSFTSRGLKEVLQVQCAFHDIPSRFYVGEYNNFAQDIFAPQGGLYQFNPQLIILFVDAQTMLGDLYLRPYHEVQELEAWPENKLQEMQSFFDAIKRHTSATVIVHNLCVPTSTALGILENKQSLGLMEAVEAFNHKLRALLKKDPQIFLYDYDRFCSRVGKNQIMDPKMYYVGDMKLDLRHMPTLCHDYLAYIKPLRSQNRKCLVIDLDNTLWGGIIGEDGLEGIKLGPTPEGRPYYELQKYIWSLQHRGVILAINSKNNPDDALKAVRQHPYMVLKEEHFSAIRINWEDKASNLISIAEELNIGLESLVFIDDDNANIEIVKQALPQVLALAMPPDPALYVSTLMTLNDFNTLQLTVEDRKKATQYAEQRKRQEFSAKVKDITEYLRGLNTVVHIQKADSFTIPRIAQLTQKTNQFNMTTRRYTEEQVQQMTQSRHYIVISIRAEDKFGDNGIIGVAIIEKKTSVWRIDSFLLSCRVIGRKIEETLLASILSHACNDGIATVIGEFISSTKNDMAKDFYKNNGFTLSSHKNDLQTWEYIVSKPYLYPDFIQVTQEL